MKERRERGKRKDRNIFKLIKKDTICISVD
jgi:hypothetical protein